MFRFFNNLSITFADILILELDNILVEEVYYF